MDHDSDTAPEIDSGSSSEQQEVESWHEEEGEKDDVTMCGKMRFHPMWVKSWCAEVRRRNHWKWLHWLWQS